MKEKKPSSKLQKELAEIRSKYVSLRKDIDKIIEKRRFKGRTWLLVAKNLIEERKVVRMTELRDKLCITNSGEMRRIIEFSEGAITDFHEPREKKLVFCDNRYSPLHELRRLWNTDLKDSGYISKEAVENLFTINGKTNHEKMEKMLDFIKKHFGDYVDVRNGGIVRKDYNGGAVI